LEKASGVVTCVTFFSGYKPSLSTPHVKSFSVAQSAFVAAAVSNPGDEHIITEHTSISNQLSLSSCVANCVGDLLEIVIGLEDPTKVVQLSRLHLYWSARSYTRDTGVDEGTTIANAVDSLRTLGVCRESTWPYDVSKVFAQPPLRAYQESLDNKILEYYRVYGGQTSRADGVEAAVRANHPVTIATAVDNSFLAYRGGGDAIKPPSSWVGYHAMIVVGVRQGKSGREFLLRNSWGDGWGDDGRVWVDESYISFEQTSDTWVVTRVPSLVF
jgi:C1A family cysteine protease